MNDTEPEIDYYSIADKLKPVEKKILSLLNKPEIVIHDSRAIAKILKIPMARVDIAFKKFEKLGLIQEINVEITITTDNKKLTKKVKYKSQPRKLG